MMYRGATWLAGAVLAPWARGDLASRLMRDPPEPADLWFHAASIGEITSLRPIIDPLVAEFKILITTNTSAGRDLAKSWGFDAVLAPMDTPQAVRRFVLSVQPRVFIGVENEIWPNRSQILARRGIPQIVIGARISQKSARRWQYLRGVITPILTRLDGLSAQDRQSEARFLDLGLPKDILLPRIQLKLLGPAQTPPLQDPPPARMQTLLAASTHEGEDEIILDAYLAARAMRPSLRLILAPRHPRRAAAISALMKARNLPHDRRSQGGTPGACVLLADTMGEMALWYHHAGICLTGGSLVDRGGHTPWEPAAREMALLHGPYISNFRDDYARLAEKDAALSITAPTLANGLITLIDQPENIAQMGQRARQILLQQAGDPAPLIDHIRRSARHPGLFSTS